MKAIKTLDFYRKYTNEDKISTCVGAWISLLTIAIVLMLSTYELSFYLIPSMRREVTLHQASLNMQENLVPLNFDVLFYKVPCQFRISFCTRVVKQLYQRDNFGIRVVNLVETNTTTLRRLNSYYEYVDDNYVSPQAASRAGHLPLQMQILLTQVLENEGCEASGYLNVFKVRKTLSLLGSGIAPVLHHPATKRLRTAPTQYRRGDQQADSVSQAEDRDFRKAAGAGADDSAVCAVVLSCSFGKSSVTDFNKAEEVGMQRDVNFCLYYLKAVPHRFYVGKERLSHETYQYSIVYSCDRYPKPIAGFQVTIAYDITPVGINYSLEEFSLLQLATALSAIIAGVYIIMSVLKRMLDKLF